MTAASGERKRPERNSSPSSADPLTGGTFTRPRHASLKQRAAHPSRQPGANCRQGGALPPSRVDRGERIVLVPDNSPILPGATRTIALYPQADDRTAAAPAIDYPVRIRGRLDAERQRLDIDTALER